MKKHSLVRRIGLYFSVMIVFASVISGFSLMIMASNQSDAALINVSGSLRMQSYRLIYEMEHHPNQTEHRLIEYQESLNSPELLQLPQHWYVPQDVIARYQHLKQSWAIMEKLVRTNHQAAYVENIEKYAGQVNAFVSALQSFVELKLRVAIGVISFSMALMLLMVYFGIWYIRKSVILPLNQLVTASIQVQNENFKHIPLPVKEPNELGTLSSTFTQMANELAKLYFSLEEKVEDKTRRLIAVNRSLLVLYQCSQLLTNQALDREVLIQVLQTVLNNEHLQGIELQIFGADHWNILIDKSAEGQWRTNDVIIKDQKLALLKWKPSLLCPDERLIESVSQMIGRSLYVQQTQKQQQQLVLMEERAIIARELHDSLAQSLAFFKIQLSLLKRNSEITQDWQKQMTILEDFQRALNDAYSQLRELLATFRLTIQEANLTQALEHVIESLKPQTSATICLKCKLPSHIFSAQQQVHVLQIVREAVINAIKHSDATKIDVIAETNLNGEHCLVIKDNGKGIASTLEPEGHYGLTIMSERASQLKGEFHIQSHPEGGTEVIVLLPNMLL